MGNTHHFDNHWEDERTFECTVCGTAVDLTHCTDGAVDIRSKKHYLHYKMSVTKRSFSVGVSIEAGADSDGPSIGAGVNGSMNIDPGFPLVMMAGFESYRGHYCMVCLPPQVAKSVMLTINGTGYAISSNYVLNNAEYGKGPS